MIMTFGVVSKLLQSIIEVIAIDMCCVIRSFDIAPIAPRFRLSSVCDAFRLETLGA